MIRSFRNKETQSLWETGKSRRMPTEVIKRSLVKLQSLDAAENIERMALPPANYLEKLSDDLAGFWSVRISEQWWLIFRYVDNDAFDVAIVDYH